MTATLAAPPRRELRDYQRDAVDALAARWAAGSARLAGVAATGLGKTDVIAYVATEAAAQPSDKGPVLILAHRDELLNQITERCLMHDPSLPVGRVQAGQHRDRTPIVAAMAPTMARAKRRQRMRRPRLVIVDECHHASSPSYLSILRWAGCFDEVDPTPLLGLTATLTRGDKRGLGDVFESPVAFEYGTVWAIEQGWLVRPHGRVVVGEHLDLDHAKVSKGDYRETELGEMVAQDVDAIVAAWREHARLPDGSPRLTVAFVPTIAAAHALADEFRAAGVPVGEVYGSTSHGDRAKVYADLAAGRIHVLINVMVATEGWDCPPVSCVLVARPTKLPGLYTQMVGRGLRLSPGTGKTDCLVLDVVGASRTQRLATLAELVPGAEVDTVELDVLPCEGCGGYTDRRPQVVALAVQRGMDPCSCTCPDCTALLSACRCGEGLGRDPDGGRRRLRGRAAYAEVDLLGMRDADAPAGGLNWLTTEAGDVFVAVGDRFVVLNDDGGGRWSAAAVAAWGPRNPHLITEGLSLPSTRVMVEKWVRAEEARGVKVYGSAAPWRRKNEPPSDRQVAAARNLGIPDPEGMTKGACSDAMDVERATRQLAPQPKPASRWQDVR